MWWCKKGNLQRTCSVALSLLRGYNDISPRAAGVSNNSLHHEIFNTTLSLSGRCRYILFKDEHYIIISLTTTFRICFTNSNYVQNRYVHATWWHRKCLDYSDFHGIRKCYMLTVNENAQLTKLHGKELQVHCVNQLELMKKLKWIFRELENVFFRSFESNKCNELN